MVYHRGGLRGSMLLRTLLQVASKQCPVSIPAQLREIP